jgi:hypothetical protein
MLNKPFHPTQKLRLPKHQPATRRVGDKKIDYYKVIKKMLTERSAQVKEFLHDFYTCEDGNHALCRIAPAAAGQPVVVTLNREAHHWPPERQPWMTYTEYLLSEQAKQDFLQEYSQHWSDGKAQHPTRE